MHEIAIPDELFTAGGDREERGEKFLLDAIDLALQQGVLPIQLDFDSNATPMYSSRDAQPVGWNTSPSILVSYESPAVEIDIKIKSTPSVELVHTKNELEITLSELHDGHECPACGEEFDTVTWENTTEFGENDKAEWVYACPTECDGEVVLVTD